MKPRIVISVRGGCAYVEFATGEVEVTIMDFDGRQEPEVETIIPRAVPNDEFDDELARLNLQG